MIDNRIKFAEISRDERIPFSSASPTKLRDPINRSEPFMRDADNVVSDIKLRHTAMPEDKLSLTADTLFILYVARLSLSLPLTYVLLFSLFFSLFPFSSNSW